jgi:hypothetical protein
MKSIRSFENSKFIKYSVRTMWDPSRPELPMQYITHVCRNVFCGFFLLCAKHSSFIPQVWNSSPKHRYAFPATLHPYGKYCILISPFDTLEKSFLWHLCAQFNTGIFRYSRDKTPTLCVCIIPFWRSAPNACFFFMCNNNHYFSHLLFREFVLLRLEYYTLSIFILLARGLRKTLLWNFTWEERE